jgi:hypothetical protein
MEGIANRDTGKVNGGQRALTPGYVNRPTVKSGAALMAKFVAARPLPTAQENENEDCLPGFISRRK